MANWTKPTSATLSAPDVTVKNRVYQADTSGNPFRYVVSLQDASGNTLVEYDVPLTQALPNASDRSTLNTLRNQANSAVLTANGWTLI